MILFALAGYAGSRFLGVELAFPVGVFAGLLLAPLVPAKTSCTTPTREADQDGE